MTRYLLAPTISNQTIRSYEIQTNLITPHFHIDVILIPDILAHINHTFSYQNQPAGSLNYVMCQSTSQHDASSQHYVSDQR